MPFVSQMELMLDFIYFTELNEIFFIYESCKFKLFLFQ